MSDVQRAGEFWDREIEQQQYVSWMADPQVRLYINRSVDPEQGAWPLDWFQRQVAPRKFRRALSVGCGGGAFERDLLRRELAESITGVDASVHSLATARSAALASGLSGRIHYAAIDFNKITFPADDLFDLVAFHQSAHHVSTLEMAFAAILEVMTPDGVLYLDEYVGPSRFEWNSHRLLVARQIYRSIPRVLRTHDELPRPLAAADPSEAIRSSEILPLLRIGFDVEVIRGYGGNLLSLVFPNLKWRSIPDREALVSQLIATEKEMLQMRDAEPFHVVVIARPKKVKERLRAAARYRRSLSRVTFMLRRLLRRSAFPPVYGHV